MIQFKSIDLHNIYCFSRTMLLLMILFCGFVNLNAQKEPNFKLKVAAGLNWKPAEKDVNLLGQIYGLEFNLKTSKKTFIGLRIQANENHSNNEKYKPTQFFIDNNFRINVVEDTPSTLISLVPTVDYYFGENDIKPYFGIGVGIYRLAPSIKSLQQSNSLEVLQTSIDKQIGFLIRGGIDIWKLTIGLEYNYLSETSIKIPNGLVIGTVDDSFLACSIGYLFRNRR